MTTSPVTESPFTEHSIPRSPEDEQLLEQRVQAVIAETLDMLEAMASASEPLSPYGAANVRCLTSVQRGSNDPIDLWSAGDILLELKRDKGASFHLLERSAKLGNFKAKCLLGFHYLKDATIQEDMSRGIALLTEAANEGNLQDAQYNLGVYSEGACQDLPQARYWHTRAAEQGKALSQFELGCLFEKGGPGLERNLPQACYWYTQAAEQGHLEAQNQLGSLLLQMYSEAVIPQGVEWYRRAAKQGHREAQYNLMWRFFLNRNTGIPKDVSPLQWYRGTVEQRHLSLSYSVADVPQVLSWYTQAASLPSCPSYNLMGRWVQSNDDNVTIDLPQVLDWYTQAAQQGHATAQYSLGRLLDENHPNLPADIPRAMDWYTRAAEQGDLRADNMLGYWFINGSPGAVEIDWLQAMHWLTPAAKQGFVAAQHNLGSILTRGGHGLTADLRQGIQWYFHAAAQGDPRSQNYLGFAYETGGGVSKDLQVAEHFYRLAAAQDEEHARDALKRFD